MYLCVNRQWDQVNGVLLDRTQSAGTVKIFEAYCASDEKEVPDWTTVQRPKLWHQQKTANNVASMNEDNENSSNSISASKHQGQEKGIADTAPVKKKNEQSGRRQIVSSKQMGKYETRGKYISGYDSSKCKTPARNHTESKATDEEGRRDNKKSTTDP